MFSSCSSLFAYEFSDFTYRLDCSDLIISEHHAYQNGIRSQSRAHILDVYDAATRNGNACDFPTAFLHCLADANHGRMLDLRNDHMTAMSFSGFTNTTNSEIVCLGTTGSENYFIGTSADQGRNGTTSSISCATSFLAKIVHAGGIPKLFSEVGQHRLNNTHVDRSGSAVIEIDFTGRKHFVRFLHANHGQILRI